MTTYPVPVPGRDLATTAVHAGREDLAALGLHVPSIDLSTTYPLPSIEAGGAAYDTLASGERPDDGATLVYQRLWNPGTDRFERAVAALEGTDSAVAFASGMAALTAVLLAAVAGGTPHVVAVRPLYGGSDHLLASGLLGTEVTWASPESVGDAIRPDTGLVLLETPANPSLDLVDIAAVVARAGDVPVVVDNTFATPVLQQPARHGAAMVLHSATKYMGGHGDVMGGVVAAGHAWTARLRQVRAITGAVLHPVAAYELHRGLQTIHVRVRAQQSTATTVAAWLCERPEVSRVHHPSLPGCDPQRLVGTQMAGPGAIVGVRLVGGYAAASALIEHLELVTHAVSLGGVDSLVQHPASLTHRIVASDARPDADLIRLSLGLESVDDVIADLDKAMANLP
ncbi:trans-sulfuration enzyme family protein [Knoellia aerolata]|uniref:homocysteine desulfhydrase n=1 Tax=Knoellia aerolata DSM 18566 TaxID=1385519 RepID=A0A0A0JSA1_9MICO|nr:PLP-dependent aspartate aminotransferase family protein [Knoellia aerolata]KGN40028.1 cystathionine gamma-synthase [Knoellia aerolata DSM 18566]